MNGIGHRTNHSIIAILTVPNWRMVLILPLLKITEGTPFFSLNFFLSSVSQVIQFTILQRISSSSIILKSVRLSMKMSSANNSNINYKYIWPLMLRFNLDIFRCKYWMHLNLTPYQHVFGTSRCFIFDVFFLLLLLCGRA